MPLDYLSSNALNKYPFDDSSSLKAADDTYLSNDTFLDIVFVSKREDVIGAYMSAFSYNAGTTNFTTTFTYFNSALTTVGTISLEFDVAEAYDKNMYGQANADVAVKLVFGVGIEDDNVAFSKTYSISTARLAQSAVILMVPRVKSIEFYNWDKDTNLPEAVAEATIEGSESTEMDLKLVEGSNVSMSLQNESAILEVIKGAGTGLYNGCGSDVLVIREINETGPDLNENFLLISDDCYVTVPVTNGLEIDNICTPKCTAEQMAAFAHYLNRITDGLTWVRDFAVTISDSLQDEIDAYNASLASMNAPYIKAKLTKFATIDSGVFYYSVSVGAFNPTDETVSFTCTTTTSGTYRPPARFKVGNTTTTYTPGTITADVPCRHVGIYEFVVRGTAATTLSITGSVGATSFTQSFDLT